MHQGEQEGLVKGEDPLGDIVDQPVDALEQVEAGDRAALDDLPVVADDLVQLQHLPDLLQAEGAWKVLLVGEDEEGGPEQPLLLQQALQLLLAILQPPPVRRVYDPDQSVGGFEVVPPVRPKRLLSSNVPDVELEPSVIQSLDIET